MILRLLNFAIIIANIVSVSCVGNGSLTFVVDDTGSMYLDIELVRKSTDAIMDIVLNKKTTQIENTVLVTFNDPETKTKLRVPGTRSKQEINQALRDIHVGGGGDCPEYSLNGINMGLAASLSNSILFVFTDAPSKEIYYQVDISKHGHYDYYLKENDNNPWKKVQDVVNIAQTKQSQIFFMITPNCGAPENFKPYYDIAKATNGQVFKLNRKDDIEKFYIYWQTLISGEGTVITTQEVEAHKRTSISFTVDDQTEYVLVSASSYANGLYLDITKPPGQIYEKLTWDENNKILKINNPSPGLYALEVEGSSTTTIKVFGRTDFTFQHEFSEIVAPTFGNGKKQPTEGMKYHLLVKVADKAHAVDIRGVELWTPDGKTLLHDQLPLTRKGGDYYATDLFLAPNTLFVITVIGQAKQTNKEIRRTAKTPIQPRPRNVDPIITINGGGQYEYNSDVVLKCNVEAYPPPTIVWKNDKGYAVHASKTSSTSKYNYVSELHINHLKHDASYHCDAVNVGSASQQVDLRVKSPFIVEHQDKIPVDYGEQISLHCSVKSLYPTQIYWYRFKTGSKYEHLHGDEKYEISKDGKEMIVKEVLQDEKYVCVTAIADDRETQYDFLLEVVVNPHGPPEILSDDNRLLTAIVGDAFLRIPCKVVGSPTPTISWTKDDLSELKGQKFRQEGDGTLVINNPQIDDTGKYLCKASNKVGSTNKTFEVLVTDYLDNDDDSDNITYIDILEGNTKELPCHNGRWFKEGYAINKTGPLTINNATTDHDGNYTCRIIDKTNTQSHTYVVEVGFAPKLSHPNDEDIDWKGHDNQDALVCKTFMKPEERTAKVEWFYNGKLSKLSKGNAESSWHPIKWGNYTCRISNVHGTVSKNFQVYSSGCLLPLHSDAKKSPLILSSEGGWPSFEESQRYYYIRSEESLIFSCNNQKTKNTFQNMPDKTQIEVSCDHEKQFRVEGKTYELSELDCNNEVTPAVHPTGESCASKTNDETEIIKVGYNLTKPEPHFLEVYSVCYDKTNKVPIHIGTESNYFNPERVDATWHRYDELQIEKDAEICVNNSQCCLKKLQLVDQLDVMHGPPQTSTFVQDLNTVFAWRGCNTDDIWDKVVDAFQQKSRPYNIKSGAHKYSNVSGKMVPRFVWKSVKRFGVTTTVVIVNDPTPKPEDKLCNTNCPNFIPHNNYTFCCSLNEFRSLFVSS